MARIGIVGGGIIGSTCASWLMSEGHSATLFEPALHARPASAGNAGLIALSEIEPLAQRETLASVPRWLLEKNGPFLPRLPDVLSMLPWLLAFVRNARPKKVERSRRALAGLMKDAVGDHREIAQRAGLSGHVRETGALTVYDREASVKAAMKAGRHVEALLGFSVDRLSPAQARAQVPELDGPFAGATFVSNYWTVGDPAQILEHHRDAVRDRGHLVQAAARAVLPAEAKVEVVTGEGARHAFDFVVISAGIWSRDLVKRLGLKVLLETERGYNTTFRSPELRLSMPVFFGEHGFVATPLADALRVGGTVELAHLDAPADPKRAAAMCKKMRRYVSQLPQEGGEEWMGCRPSTPDSLPVISRHPRDRRILLAFGHGHLGLTLSATTGRHIAALVADRDDEHRLAPFSIARFQ